MIREQNLVNEMRRDVLTNGNIKAKQRRHLYSRIQSSPRSVQCLRPFAGAGRAALRMIKGRAGRTRTRDFVQAATDSQPEIQEVP